MQRVIHQLLMITRGDEARYSLSMESVDLAEVAHAVADQLLPQAQKRGIHIAVDTPEKVMFTGDQSLLTQMMLNLTENAIKYSKPNGCVRIDVKGTENECILTICDDGIGIASDALPHIFERFYRADAARDRTGTGLGLSIVQWIVELHGGDIHVQSKLGIGTSFSVTLART